MRASPSDDDDGFDYADPDGFDFPDPCEEVRRLRAERKAPRMQMGEEEALVHAIVTSEAEMTTARQIQKDAELARRLEIEALRASIKEAAARHRRQFARRWQCLRYMYDATKLRAFCKRYDLPFASEQSAPMPWADRLAAFATTRRHAYDACKSTFKPEVYRLYLDLDVEYKRKTSVNRNVVDFRCGLLSAQLLLAHVHLCYDQFRSEPSRVQGVVDYVYGSNASGKTDAMLDEAAEWLGVLVQLAMKFGIHYPLGRQAVPMILRQLLTCDVPSWYVSMLELRSIKPFIQVPIDSRGIAKEEDEENTDTCDALDACA